MSSARPIRLGLSACFFHADPQRAIFKGKTLLYLEQSLSQWLMSEGALVYLIPSIDPGQHSIPFSLRELAREMDGLVLQGGSDVSPSTYGEKPLRPEWSGDAHRDSYEISLLREFLAQQKPVLGICRGAQLLNVAFGGTLYQDIGTQLPQALNHRDWQIYDQNFHEVRFESDSLFTRFTGSTQGRINTVHHQAIRDLGKGLRIEGLSPQDGIVEAVRAESGPFTYAVQWHPEFQDPKDPTLLDSKPLLREFLRQAHA